MIEFPVFEGEIKLCLKFVLNGVYETVPGGVTADIGIRMKIVPEKRQSVGMILSKPFLM